MTRNVLTALLLFLTTAVIAESKQGAETKSSFDAGSCCAKAEKKGANCKHGCCKKAAKEKRVCKK